MKDLKKLLFSSLAKQKIAAISKGAMINKIFSDYIKNEFNLNYNFKGKIENNIYIVKSSFPTLSNLIFLNKKKVLDHINLKLKEMNLDKINDIKIL